MMYNVHSVQQHELFAKQGKSANPKHYNIFQRLLKQRTETIGKTRHHNVMLELDNVRDKPGSYSAANWNNLVLECRDQIVGDPYLQGVNAFRRMVKTYTNNIVYTNIGKKMRTSQFEDIQSYCTTLIEGLNAHGPERRY